MEGNKLDLSGGKPTNNLSSTYKPIPETDTMEEKETGSRAKNVVKTTSTNSEADGADEKMLPKDEKINPHSNIEISNIKISEKENGDAKLDIGDLKSAFVGLTKEELMKYANDPFWIRLRWFLFISFWVLWASMLVGAVVIIYVAPKCDPPPKKTWWEEGPLTEAKFDLQSDQILALRQKNVQGVIVAWPEDAYATVDESHDFIDLLKKCKEHNLKVIVELEPGSSNRWFEQSESLTPDFTDYYIWKTPKQSDDGENQPPNNWLTVQNTSSWTFSTKRKEYFYSPSGTPHLNFRNSNVTEEFSKVLRTFVNYGVGGIRLKGVPILLVDPKFEDESISYTNNPAFIHTDYGFYSHSKTEHLNGLAPLLKQWRDIVKNNTVDRPFMAAEELSNIEAYRLNGTLVLDLPVESHIFTEPSLNVSSIVKRLHSVFNASGIAWPLWKYHVTEKLDMVTYLLPGVPLIDGDLPINSDLLEIRKQASIMRGTFNFYSIANGTIFAFTRVASGNPGYLIALNPTNERIVVDFPKEISAAAAEVTVQMFSSNYNETGVGVNLKHDASNIPISPKSTLVLSYVPKQKK